MGMVSGTPVCQFALNSDPSESTCGSGSCRGQYQIASPFCRVPYMNWTCPLKVDAHQKVHAQVWVRKLKLIHSPKRLQITLKSLHSKPRGNPYGESQRGETTSTFQSAPDFLQEQREGVRSIHYLPISNLIPSMPQQRKNNDQAVEELDIEATEPRAHDACLDE